MVIKADVFERIGLEYVKNTPPQVANIKRFLGVSDTRSVANQRHFRAFFGASPLTCERLWTLLNPKATMPKGVQPFHLLWGLVFMKVYATEAVHCKIVDSPDEKTFQKWFLLFVREISYLEADVVSAKQMCHLRLWHGTLSPFCCCYQRFVSKIGSTATG